MERRLAAILAADVVGYSRLMGQDEAGTLARLEGLKAEILGDCLGRRGRLQPAHGCGEVRLDNDKIDRMGFWTPPTDENRAIRKAEAGNLSNDGAIWVTSLWKPSYLGYIG